MLQYTEQMWMNGSGQRSVSKNYKLQTYSISPLSANEKRKKNTLSDAMETVSDSNNNKTTRFANRILCKYLTLDLRQYFHATISISVK